MICNHSNGAEVEVVGGESGKCYEVTVLLGRGIISSCSRHA